jgi:diguanylate cyclase
LRLQSKIIAVLVPLVVVPLLTMGWISYRQLQETTEHQTLVEMRAKLEQLRQQLDDEVDHAVADVRLFANAALLRQYLLSGDENERYTLLQSPLLRQFAGYHEAHPQYYEIRVLAPDGEEDARYARPGLGNARENEARMPYFRALRKSKGVYKSFFHNPDNGEVSLLVGRPIGLRGIEQDPIAAPEVLRGYLAVTVDIGRVEPLIKASRIGQTGWMFLTDERGKVLFHGKDGEKGKVVPEALFAPLRQLAQAGDAASAYSARDLLYLGMPVQKQLYLFAALPQAELTGASRRLGVIVAAITFGAILLTVVSLLAYLKYALVRPVQALARTAREIGAGILVHRLPVHTRDELGELASAFQDMSTNLAASNERVHFLAYHDTLTHLPNRLMFNEYLARAFAFAKRSGQRLALLFLDVDNFKRINDTLGHQTGDRLLEQVAKRLSSCLRTEDCLSRSDGETGEDTVARLGGDEFTFILPNIKHPHVAASVAARIQTELAKPFRIDQHEVFVTSSIGISIYPEDAQDAQTLVSNADVAMFHAKKRGKNNYQYYARSMNIAAFEKLTLEGELRKAIERDEFVLYYQPLFDCRTERILGVEALVRWQHPERGLVPPDQFIPLAEESGLIVPLGEWVLRTACTQMKTWHDQGLDPICVSVNLSSVQFRNQRVDQQLAQILRETQLAPQHLVLEITESALMQAEEEVADMLVAAKALGVRISLDDFGTGYSSLSYLRRFPIDNIKIDRSFVQDIISNQSNAAITKAIIALAHGLGLSVTAEGVEHQDEFEFLRRHECDKIQGYLLSRPLPAVDIVRLLMAPPRFVRTSQTKQR